MRAQASVVVVDAEADALVVAAVAVVAALTEISESSVAVLAVHLPMVVASADPQLLPMAVASEVLLPQLLSVVPQPTVAVPVVDMAEAPMVTHPGVAAAASPGGKSLFDGASAPFSTFFGLWFKTAREAGIKASY